MPFDGIFLHKVKTELSALIGAHTDKIYQPSRDELVFLLRSREGAFRLLISARQGAARIHLTDSKVENPINPPMFCMLLRKHLGSSKLVDIKQLGFERVLTLIFSSKNEMGDTVLFNLVCEFIGNKPNIILISENGSILDAVHRSDIENSSRLIQPGAVYEYPNSTGKLNILNHDTKTVAETVFSLRNKPLWKAVLDTIEGFSPLNSREIALNSCGDYEKVIATLSDGEKACFIECLEKIKQDITENSTPIVIFDDKSSPFDFSYSKISQYDSDYTLFYFDSFSKALDAFYSERENAERIKKSAQDIIKTITTTISRIDRKTALRKRDLESCKDREKYRIYGELIKANLYRIPTGVSFFEAENYYDENCSLITIPMDPSISPALNADKYFKDYKKSYTAEKMLTKLIEKDNKDLEYFNSVLDNISRAKTISDIDDIREELNEVGLIKIARNTAKKPKMQNNFIELNSPCGMKIFVGKNNRQNDLLTLNVASKNDIWFHVKNIPGSHTVLITEGKEANDEDIVFAAGVAAFHSKANSSSNVPVDYTLIKYVKKPSGAKPGMVIYSGEQTIFVTPDSKIHS